MKDTYKGTSTYDYAGRRKLEGAVPGNGLYTGMSFDYNHLNERTFRTGSNLDRQYAYDESSHLIGEYTGNGALIVEYIWLGDRPIAAVYSGNRIVYLVTDHQNKPRRGIDAATQQTVWSWDPDAFGVLQPATGLTNGVEMNLRFPGQYYDIQSGLYYNHNRYYNPELGRYMEPDPIGLEGGLNPYSYASNNPVNNVDPSGLIDFNFNFSGMNIGASLPSIPDPVYQGAMGFANGASLGLGQPISNWAMGYQTANVTSPWYTAGGLTSAFAGGAGAGKIGVQTVKWNVDNFINSFTLPKANVTIPTSVIDKIPANWGIGAATKKGDGWRWQSPDNVGSGVRIDMGNPNNSQVIQQVDHVLIRDNGRVIGSGGRPIQGAIKTNPAEAHIPLTNYEKWARWNAP